jgi:endonuclease YncB( thermonuclease family)
VLVRIIDGDTVEIEIRRTLRVRMLDCWAPESRTKDLTEKALGIAAKQHLGEICPIGSPVTLFIPSSQGGHVDSVFSMGRVLGAVWAADGDPRDLSQRQRDAGHATATQEESQYSGAAKRKRKRKESA